MLGTAMHNSFLLKSVFFLYVSWSKIRWFKVKNEQDVNVQKKKKKKLTLFSPVPISDLIRQYLEKIQKALFVM